MTSQSKPIEDALPALKDLFESLQRAGDHWDLGTSLSTDATPRGYEALLPLKARLPRGDFDQVNVILLGAREAKFALHVPRL